MLTNQYVLHFYENYSFHGKFSWKCSMSTNTRSVTEFRLLANSDFFFRYLAESYLFVPVNRTQ